MKLRAFVAGAVVAGFLSGVPALPALVHADQYHPGVGAYDQHHTWHTSSWWLEHHPDWVQAHHPEWAKNGDWDQHHHWHDRAWWKTHDPKWSHEHHPDWF
jgi:hypothetical protein